MWLTLYYVAATWLQSWRLSSMRAKVFKLLEQKGSLVLYKETKHSDDFTESGSGWPAGVSSPFCLNHFEARPGELLCYSNEKRGCAVFPQQIVDCSSWLSGWWLPVSDESISSPSSVSSQAAPSPPSTPQDPSSISTAPLQVLLECDWRPHSFENEQHTWSTVERYGSARAWRLSIETNRLGLILETDAARFAELAVRFLASRPITLHVERLELLRIQSIQLQGQPCLIINADSLPLAKDNAALRLGEAQLDLLQSISDLSSQACEEGRVITIPGYETTRILPSAQLEQNTPSNNATLAIAPGESSVESSLYSLSLEEHQPPKQPPAAPSSPGETDSFCSLGSASTASPSVSSPQAHPRSVNLPSQQIATTVDEITESLTPTSTPTALTLPTAAPRQIPPANIPIISPSSSHLSPIPAPAFPPKIGPKCPPPNILVYAESATGMDATISTLRSCLDSDRYAVYPMTASQLASGSLIDYCQLLVVWGDVTEQQAAHCISHLLSGGRLLGLCSDLYRCLVPGGSAEVRENELVQFSYGKWTQVKLLHHIFCYQASPAKPKPETDRCIELRDSEGKTHPVSVKVLAVEDTWHTPSLLLASSKANEGVALFSQVHLELDPQQVAAGNVDDSASLILQRSDQARLDILRDVLGTHLGLKVSSGAKKTSPSSEPAYFLGRHEIKQELLSALEPRLGPERVLRLGGGLSLQLCGKGSVPPPPSPASSGMPLPVMLHACPRHFDTVTYFDRLSTTRVGRLLLLAEVLPSTQTILHGEGCLIHDGLAVLANRQTSGQGRSGNRWLSPTGCATFSVQIHIPGGTYLAAHPSFVQHVAALAMVQSVVGEPGLETLDLRIKWPNDVYLGLSAKVGGILVNTTHIDDRFICTIGCGLNLNNPEPTISIAKAIEDLGPNKPSLSLEKYLASVFSRLEYLLDQCQAGAVDNVLNEYYARWLHSNQPVEVVDSRGQQRESAVIQGIDEDGFLLARLNKGGRLMSLHPDGNSLDMFRGLIAPKM